MMISVRTSERYAKLPGGMVCPPGGFLLLFNFLSMVESNCRYLN